MQNDRFVAPHKGIYLFSFSGQTTDRDVGHTIVQVRRGGRLLNHSIKAHLKPFNPFLFPFGLQGPLVKMLSWHWQSNWTLVLFLNGHRELFT